MKNFAVLCATALAMATPGIAQAATPDGDHTFTGTLEVRKNLPLWTSCTVTIVVDVTSGVPSLQSASASGSSTCTGITFSGFSGTTLNTSGLPIVVQPAIRIDIAAIPLLAPADACAGSLTLVWGGNSGSTRTITFVDGTSNIPDANPDNAGATENACRIRGVLTQNPGSLNL